MHNGIYGERKEFNIASKNNFLSNLQKFSPNVINFIKIKYDTLQITAKI